MVHVLLNTKGGKEALDYLENRGYTVETLKEFGFGFSLKDRTQLEQVLQELQLTDEEKEASGLFFLKNKMVSLIVLINE